MENSYIRNSFIFAGKTLHFMEPSIISEYSPSQQQELSFQLVGSDALSNWLFNDEYIGSTSPYDDDGKQV